MQIPTRGSYRGFLGISGSLGKKSFHFRPIQLYRIQILLIRGEAIVGPKGCWSEGSLVRRVVSPKGCWSESMLTCITMDVQLNGKLNPDVQIITVKISV